MSLTPMSDNQRLSAFRDANRFDRDGNPSHERGTQQLNIRVSAHPEIHSKLRALPLDNINVQAKSPGPLYLILTANPFTANASSGCNFKCPIPKLILPNSRSILSKVFSMRCVSLPGSGNLMSPPFFKCFETFHSLLKWPESLGIKGKS